MPKCLNLLSARLFVTINIGIL